jgi:indole-3-glycerol phosphate synthase
MNVLEQICAQKRAHVEVKKAHMSQDALVRQCVKQSKKQRFKQALLNKKKSGDVALITEVKKASPSKGIIRDDFNPVHIAKIYEAANATCISVLTDAPYFQGSDEDFTAVRAAVTLPLLRKDFMVDEYQIYESCVLGADCVLLIMAALNDGEIKRFSSIARDLGMDILAEIHDENELNRALSFDFDIIGINNRDLRTLKVSLQTSQDLIHLIPQDSLKVSESGISSREDIEMLSNCGFDAFLIGETLMRDDDMDAATRALTSLKTNKT